MDLFVSYDVWDVIRELFTEEERDLLYSSRVGYIPKGVLVGVEKLTLTLGIKLAEALVHGNERVKTQASDGERQTSAGV